MAKVAFWILIFLIPLQVFSQRDFFKGNRNDDMYYCSVSNNKRIICRFTEHGSNVDIKECYNGLIDYAEPTEGTIVGRMHHSIYKSEDAGTTFSQVSTPAMLTYAMCGGAIAGECIIFSFTEVFGISTNLQIFKSFDNGITQTLVKDSTDFFFNFQVGVVSGEIYTQPLIDGVYYLCHSTDFGATFDTISFDASIFQQNDSKFFSLSPGPKEGELYMVSATNTCPLNHIYIYHSTDYGRNWELKSENAFDCGDLIRCCSGRAPGSFYILHKKAILGDIFPTIDIYSSIDSGQTFNKYEHLLDHSLSLPEKDSLQSFSVRPNPAHDECIIEYRVRNNGNFRLNISATEGKSRNLLNANQTTGMHSYKLDCSNYTPGVYVVSLVGEDGFQTSLKLVISK